MTKNVTKRSIQFDDYREWLFSRKEHHRKMNVIRSHCHETEDINKIALSSDDDKRIIMADGIHTLARSLGCNDLTAGKKFTLLLGSDINMLSYCAPNSGLPVPVKIKTDGRFSILTNELPICNFSQIEILRSRPIDMGQYLIKNMKNPVNRFDAVNKAYVDRITYKTATGIIPNTVMSDHTLFTFPTAKAFSSGKIILCEIWVERLADEWIATSSSMFATTWPGFHKFSPRYPSLMTFFSGSTPVVGLTIFASTIYNYHQPV